jgi:hypothetical protein
MKRWGLSFLVVLSFFFFLRAGSFGETCLFKPIYVTRLFISSGRLLSEDNFVTVSVFVDGEWRNVDYSTEAMAERSDVSRLPSLGGAIVRMTYYLELLPGDWGLFNLIQPWICKTVTITAQQLPGSDRWRISWSVPEDPPDSYPSCIADSWEEAREWVFHLQDFPLMSLSAEHVYHLRVRVSKLEFFASAQQRATVIHMANTDLDMDNTSLPRDRRAPWTSPMTACYVR